MFGLIARLLSFFYDIWPSYGGAIALLTLTVMVVVTPLTLKGTRSMLIMQMHQPEMKKIQQQYKDDRQKLNEELMKFYKENNISPFGGCLPLLIQAPVFIVLFRVLRGLTDIRTNNPALPQGVTRGFVPDYLDKSSALYHSLLGKLEMKSFGIDLAKSATEAMKHSFTSAIPYLLLVLVVAGTSIVQQRQIAGRNPAAAGNPQQQLMMKIGPIMLTFISLVSPGGLVIYFVVSNLYRVGQQALITRTVYSTPEAKNLLERQAKEAEEKLKQNGGAAPKGFFKQLLGDAAPNVGEARSNKGNTGKGSGGGKTTGGKGASTGKAGSANGKTTPPGNRPSSGRTTPPGARSSSARKKKRK